MPDFAYLLAALFASGIFLWQIIKRFSPWILDDLSFLKTFAVIVKKLHDFKAKDIHFCAKVIENAKKVPHRKFILYEEEEWSYKEMDEWSNRCARGLRKVGLEANNKAGILMMNEPAFVALWIGCNKAGVTASFLNFNLRLKSLLHCIDVSEVKVLVIGKDDVLIQAAKQIDEELKIRNIKVFVYGPPTKDYQSFSSIVDEQPFEDCPYSWRKDMAYNDPICYIFTSGTTGLPKAVNIGNDKSWSGAFCLSLCKPQPQDVVYTCMPLYHSAASLIGVCGTVLAGCTIVLRKKFSATHFWSDCRRYNITIAQYVGETLRYVCNRPATPEDKNHCVRAVIGNGLRPDVWKIFLERYGNHIHVMEFYAATEGNVGFFNLANKFGCIGTHGPLLRLTGLSAIIKYDVDKDEIICDENGRAIRADYDEPGLLIGKITKARAISYYKGKESLTEKKILGDVFKKGDRYFNTGDLLKIDRQQLVHFCDRIGDTFRWKGENVSTNEVGDAIAQAPGIQEANAYGVQIPGKDGRAGMAAIVPEHEAIDFKALYEHICDALPSYARPLFIRVQKEMEITGTNKQRKVNLKNEGYSVDNPANDPIYFIDNSQKTYIILTKSLQEDIEDGTVRI